MNTSSAYPLPEVVDQRHRKRWFIEQSGSISPRVELNQGVLIVPLDQSEQSRFLRDHELGHVHWSPKRPDNQAIRNKVSPDVLAAVEDMRINTKLKEAGVNMQLEVGKLYRVKSADTLKVRKHTDRPDYWGEIDGGYLQRGDIVCVEDIRQTTGGNAYVVKANDQSGVLRFDCGVNLSEFLELVG